MREVNDFLSFKELYVRNNSNASIVQNSSYSVFLGNCRFHLPRISFFLVGDETISALDKFRFINKSFFNYGSHVYYNKKYVQENKGLVGNFILESFVREIKNHFDIIVNYRGIDIQLFIDYDRDVSLKRALHKYSFKPISSIVFSQALPFDFDYSIVEDELKVLIETTYRERVASFPYLEFQFKINEIINGQRPLVEYRTEVKKAEELLFQSEMKFFINEVTYQSSIDERLITDGIYLDYGFNDSLFRSKFNREYGVFTLVNLRKIAREFHLLHKNKFSKYFGLKIFKEQHIYLVANIIAMLKK